MLEKAGEKTKNQPGLPFLDFYKTVDGLAKQRFHSREIEDFFKKIESPTKLSNRILFSRGYLNLRGGDGKIVVLITEEDAPSAARAEYLLLNKRTGREESVITLLLNPEMVRFCRTIREGGVWRERLGLDIAEAVVQAQEMVEEVIGEGKIIMSRKDFWESTKKH